LCGKCDKMRQRVGIAETAKLPAASWETTMCQSSDLGLGKELKMKGHLLFSYEASLPKSHCLLELFYILLLSSLRLQGEHTGHISSKNSLTLVQLLFPESDRMLSDKQEQAFKVIPAAGCCSEMQRYETR